MTKDEMKNRISLALKEPILQQCFEIICKENAELKKQLEDADNATDCFNKQEEIIAKAKDIIKTFLGFAEAFGYSPSMDKFISDTEQFLNSEVKK